MPDEMDPLEPDEQGLVPSAFDLGGVFPHGMLSNEDAEQLAEVQLVVLVSRDQPEEPFTLQPKGWRRCVWLMTPAAFLSLLEHDRAEPRLVDDWSPLLLCGSLAAKLTVDMQNHPGWVLKVDNRAVYLEHGEVTKINNVPHDRLACGCSDNTAISLLGDPDRDMP